MPVFMYLSTVTLPVIEFPGPTIPTLAVPGEFETRIILSPVFNLLPVLPNVSASVIFKVSLAADETDKPAPLVLLIIKFLIALFVNMLPAMI